MFKVVVTDQTHELRIYDYEYETLEQAEKHYDMEQFNALLLNFDNGLETIIKSK